MGGTMAEKINYTYVQVNLPRGSSNVLLREILDLIHLHRWKYALSFPDWTKRSMGSVVRIFGESEDLVRFRDSFEGKRIASIASIPHEKPFLVAPETTEWESFVRVRSGRLSPSAIRRLLSRGNCSPFLTMETDNEAESPDLPFFYHRSLSNRQTFPVFVKKKVWKLKGNPVQGSFCVMGLSRGGWLPAFAESVGETC